MSPFITRTKATRRPSRYAAFEAKMREEQLKKMKELGTPTMSELQEKVEARGFHFGKPIKNEFVNMYPTGYVDKAGENRKCWMTWHPTKTEKATHIPKQFDTITFRPLLEDDFCLPLHMR